MTKPAAVPHPSTQRPDEETFYLPKERVLALGQAIPALQARDDLSGKFARKVTYQRRRVLAAVEELNEERLEHVKRHAERFPKFEKDGVTPHPKAGEFTPVYAQKPDGSALFKTDANGNDTDERLVIPEQYNIVDVGAFQREWKEALREVVAIKLPPFKVGELEAFKQIRGNVMDSLVDIEEGSEYQTKPEGWTAKDAPPLELVKDAPPAVESPTASSEPGAEEERTAP
jgi:hypothetical protein